MSAEVRHLGMPTGVGDVQLAGGQRADTDLGVLLLRLTDGDGVVGHSTLWVQRHRQLDLFEASLRYFADQVVGHRLDATPAIATAMRLSTPFLGAAGVAAFGVSGFEMALQDLVLRRQGESLSRALGRVRDRVRAYHTGLVAIAPVENVLKGARDVYDRGVHACKLLVGFGPLDVELEHLGAVRDELPDMVLMVDAFQRWEYPDASRAAQRFAELGVFLMEDPLAHRDFAGYEELVRRSPIPIATGEGLFALDDFERILDAGVPYVVGELERVGGIREWLHIARVVASRGAVMMPHINPHVSEQLVATLDGREVWWEYVPWFDDLVARRFDLADGYLTVSDQPGTGLDVDLDAVERFAMGPWRALHA